MSARVWSPERWATVEMLCWRLVEMDPGERAIALAEAHRTDPDVATEVETLLTEWEADPEFLEMPVADLHGEAPDVPARRSVGPFRIVRPLGRGGMGEVFLAIDESEGIERSVALKLVRSGLDHAELLERFREERRVLASLGHPAIARLYQVGSTIEGRPYLAMEYVDGVSITVFAERHGLGIPSRVRLFQQVCAGVQHAHLRLVVHRDLKPANVLVTPGGNAKLLDFGVARMLEVEEDGADGVQAATPAYAAPEQLRGEPPGIPADVFSLGVLLYELLAGRHPFPERTLHDLPTVVPPSAHRSGIGADLDAIVDKAMAAEPDLRYWTVASLSEDLDRALTGHPVAARARTAGYVARRFARRHALPVAGAALLVLLLAGFSAVTAVQSRRIGEEAARVARERDEALAVRTFLLESFGTTGPDIRGDAATARQLLDGRAAVLESEYGDDPELHAEMLGVVAEGYERLGLYAEAEPLARRAVALRAAEDPDRAAALTTLGWIVHQAGRLEEATPILNEAIARARSTYPDGHPVLARALNDLGVNREALGDYDAAEDAYTEALGIRRALLGDDDAVVGVTASNLAVVRYRKGDLAGAAEMAEEAHALFVRTMGPDHQRSMIVENNLAAMQTAAGNSEAARATYRDILARRRRLIGDDHPNTAHSMVALATLIPPGDGDVEAEALLREALAVERASLGPDHPTLGVTAQRLAVVVARTTGIAEALPIFEEALRVQRTTQGPEHPAVGETLSLLAAAHSDRGNDQAAVAAFEEAHRIQTSGLGRDHPSTLRTGVSLAAALMDVERIPEATQLLDRTTAALETRFNDGHLLLQEARLEYVRLHYGRNDLAKADSILRIVETNLTDEQRRMRVGTAAAQYRGQLPAGG